jgi:signal transduction histidine kinase
MKLRTELRLLLAAVVVLMVGLIASLTILAQASRSLSAAHEVIVKNAAPTVVVLDTAQARLRQLHVLLLERHQGEPGDVALQDAAIEKASVDLERDIDDYLALPRDPGEAPLQDAIGESYHRVDRVVDRLLVLDTGALDRPGLRRELDAAVAELGLDLVQASKFSAHIAERSATRVARISTALLPAGATIEVITSLAAMVTLALTYRAVRRAQALAQKSLLSLQNRAEELESFAGRVAHDLLSPLMTVSLALDLADRRLSEPDDALTRKAVARASRTLVRVRGFVSDLLEFARAGAKPVPGVHAQVDEAVLEIVDEFRPLASDAGVELHVDGSTTSRAVACSPGVLTSVLSNLVQNAIKYIGEGEVRRISIRTEDHGEEVFVEVQDTGPGIAQADRDRLFELYARGRDAKAPGLGLGLATVKRLVESHGGHVGVETELGRGSVFWFSMPAAT